jgi:hypothetical protein
MVYSRIIIGCIPLEMNLNLVAERLEKSKASLISASLVDKY